MGTKKSRILPTRVDSVRRRFEHWRRTRRGLSRIPEPCDFRKGIDGLVSVAEKIWGWFRAIKN